jgi:hypothetical protein
MSKVIKHEWHLVSNYCIHCGAHKGTDDKCYRDKKVTAISHKTNRPNVLRTSNQNYNINSK